MSQITKEEALAPFDGNQAALAAALGIKPQAVQQWKDNEPIPQLRQYQLREIRPDVFGSPAAEQPKAQQSQPRVA